MLQIEINVLLFELALTFYFIAAITGIAELFRGKKASSRATLYLAIIGFLFHTANIIVRYIEGGHIPVTDMHEAASFFSWCVLVLFFYHEFRYKMGMLSSFVMPIIFVLMISSAFFSREIKTLNPVLNSHWFEIHVMLAFMGDAAFAMAFGIGTMYLLQERYVKSRHLGDLFRKLPSLQSLDEINFRLIALGFALLSLAIITGIIWAHSAWGSYWRWDPKEVWSLVTWLIYALVLHLRVTVGWRGKKAAILSIIGFAIVISAFFGIGLLQKGRHVFL